MRRTFKMFANTDNTAYTKSNEIDAFTKCPHLSSTYRSAIVEAKRDTATYRQEKSQSLVDYVCSKFSIPSVRVEVKDTPYPHKVNGNGKFGGGTLGRYHHTLVGNAPIKIEIWNLTAMKKQRRSNKEFFNTLIHELCHHLDYQVLSLSKSLHTAGFYKRISDLNHKLGG